MEYAAAIDFNPHRSQMITNATIEFPADSSQTVAMTLFICLHWSQATCFGICGGSFTLTGPGRCHDFADDAHNRSYDNDVDPTARARFSLMAF